MRTCARVTIQLQQVHDVLQTGITFVMNSSVSEVCLARLKIRGERPRTWDRHGHLLHEDAGSRVGDAPGGDGVLEREKGKSGTTLDPLGCHSELRRMKFCVPHILCRGMGVQRVGCDLNTRSTTLRSRRWRAVECSESWRLKVCTRGRHRRRGVSEYLHSLGFRV